MTTFTYDLGAIVVLDPTGQNKGPTAKIIGQITWIDGSQGYFVSVPSFRDGSIARYVLNEYEIHSVEEKP